MRKRVSIRETAADTDAQAPAAAELVEQEAPAPAPKKNKRAYAGKVRVLDTQLDYPFGTTHRPGAVLVMDESSARHFFKLGAVEFIDED